MVAFGEENARLQALLGVRNAQIAALKGELRRCSTPPLPCTAAVLSQSAEVSVTAPPSCAVGVDIAQNIWHISGVIMRTASCDRGAPLMLAAPLNVPVAPVITPQVLDSALTSTLAAAPQGSPVAFTRARGHLVAALPRGFAQSTSPVGAAALVDASATLKSEESPPPALPVPTPRALSSTPTPRALALGAASVAPEGTHAEKTLLDDEVLGVTRRLGPSAQAPAAAPAVPAAPRLGHLPPATPRVALRNVAEGGASPPCVVRGPGTRPASVAASSRKTVHIEVKVETVAGSEAPQPTPRSSESAGAPLRGKLVEVGASGVRADSTPPGARLARGERHIVERMVSAPQPAQQTPRLLPRSLAGTPRHSSGMPAGVGVGYGSVNLPLPAHATGVGVGYGSVNLPLPAQAQAQQRAVSAKPLRVGPQGTGQAVQPSQQASLGPGPVASMCNGGFVGHWPGAPQLQTPRSLVPPGVALFGAPPFWGCYPPPPPELRGGLLPQGACMQQLAAPVAPPQYNNGAPGNYHGGQVNAFGLGHPLVGVGGGVPFTVAVPLRGAAWLR